MTNSVTSFGSGYTQTTIRNRRRGVIEVDPNADILRLNIRVACCAIVLLQEVSHPHRVRLESEPHVDSFLSLQDILVESSSNDEESPLSEDSLKKLKSISDTFFETIDDICVNSGAKDLNKIVSLLDKGCKKNHLRWVLAIGHWPRNWVLIRISVFPQTDCRSNYNRRRGTEEQQRHFIAALVVDTARRFPWDIERCIDSVTWILSWYGTSGGTDFPFFVRI